VHAILIICHSAVAPAASDEALACRAEALQGVPGLVMKTWLRDGDIPRGFYLFAIHEAAAEFLVSDLAASLATQAVATGRTVRHFAVLEELSRATGTPQPLGT
jgi:hypothetical protein